MIDDDDIDDGLYITFKLETRMVRVIENLVVPSRITIKADVSPDSEATEAVLQGVIAKIKYWFEHLVSKSVAFSSDNESALAMFIDENGKNRTSNMIMLTPGEPTDEIMAALFQSKMTALAAGAVEFGFVEVSSDNLVGMSFTFVGDGLRILPEMSEWIGERSFFEQPWWARNDASTLDIVPGPDADLAKPPAWAFSLDLFTQTQDDEPIVVRPEFRPTVIDGGRRDDDE